MENIFFQTNKAMKGNLKKIKCMEGEYIISRMGIYIKEIFSKIKSKE
jgi:hypothetical protein